MPEISHFYLRNKKANCPNFLKSISPQKDAHAQGMWALLIKTLTSISSGICGFDEISNDRN